ncbi:MAG: UDP-N-acetyl-D-mannosamine dehydrogenase [Candidatus Argoarchaeum ethanivorans]|uniref:UDP-N-acetyl-D-mannosamine dehydrogenase n=1 Tax=Candidatus Argoarchaeum ethanivorans TaxID=2608793 RepID=A0A811T6D1_9EURY|nr:MAG: UDP-N-acetyl-D-mannosamine dehydrogenase [Candidatus Argoarchaeum ethanivorans]
MENTVTIYIVGLGYAGLPLAEAFSRHIRVIGYDVDEAKVAELSDDVRGIEFTTDASQIKRADFVIIAVPTLVTKSKDPDLSYIMSVVRTIGYSPEQINSGNEEHNNNNRFVLSGVRQINTKKECAT